MRLDEEERPADSGILGLEGAAQQVMDDRSQRGREDRGLGGQGRRDATIDQEPMERLGLATLAGEDADVGVFDDSLGEVVLRFMVILIDGNLARQFQEHASRLIKDIFVFRGLDDSNRTLFPEVEQLGLDLGSRLFLGVIVRDADVKEFATVSEERGGFRTLCRFQIVFEKLIEGGNQGFRRAVVAREAPQAVYLFTCVGGDRLVVFDVRATEAVD